MAADPPRTVAPGAVTDFLKQLARAPHRRPVGPVPALQPGQVLGRYQVVREIGRGGFGAVYEARDRELPRTVALKVLHVDPDVDVADERLQREAEAAAQLSHPHVVTFHDMGTSGGVDFLVLELLQGQTLGERLRRGPLAPAQALGIARDVAGGLAHAHGRGVIHRDLTPANVFLCSDGQVKVLDFGMAHGIGRPRLAGGTRPYMAPEQRRGAPEDERTDVFALGVILYQMLSGALPFPDEGSREGAEAARLEVPGAPALGDLLARMLARDPVARPRSGQEVVDALAALADGGRAPGAPMGAVRVRRAARVRSGPWLAGAVLLAGVAGVWLWRTATARVVPQAVSPAPPERPDPGPPGPDPDRPRQPEPGPRPGPPPAPGKGRTRAVECRDSIGAFPAPPVESGQGVLTIEADPYGEVFVEGKPQGEAPRECRLAAGTYRVRVVLGSGRQEAQVKVPAGERVRWLAHPGGAP